MDNKYIDNLIIELKEIEPSLYITYNLDDIKPYLIVMTQGKIKTINLPKKPINAQWILDKFTFNHYQSLYDTFKTLNLNNGRIYFTTFGFSFINIFISSERFITENNQIKQLLDDNNIEYKNEYSNAYIVYRYIISKSKDNIEKINKLMKGVK